MLRDCGGRVADRGTAVCAVAHRRDERHVAQRCGERQLADVWWQLLEQPVLSPQADQHDQRDAPCSAAIYTHGSSTLGSFETTPVVVNGIMYITSPVKLNFIVRALHLRSPKLPYTPLGKP